MIERESRANPLSSFVKRVDVVLVLSLVALMGGIVWQAFAQSDESLWEIPVNVSQSGAASAPVVAVAPDGALHVLWWDAFQGEQYVRTVGVTGTAWTQPVAVPQIIGQRQVNTNIQTGRVSVVLTAPRAVRALSDARGNISAFWFDVDNQLFSARIQAAGASGVTAMSDSAVSMDAAADVSGTLRLAYIQSATEAGKPGVYYRATAGGDWSAPSLVYGSAYFRAIKPGEAHVSVAGDGRGQVLVAWNDPTVGRSFFTRSVDDGRTWSTPQAVTGGPSNQPMRIHLAAAPQGEFLMLWQDSGADKSCYLSQRRSTDGGQTWNPPERILGDLSGCLGDWSFVMSRESSLPGEGQLWLISRSESEGASVQSNSATLAVWDGNAWSRPVDVTLRFRDAAANRSVSLACLGLAVAGQSVGVVGCDASGDVWATRNVVGLDRLVPALRPTWSALESLSDKVSRVTAQDLPALAAGTQGRLYALWSQSAAEDQPGVALYAAVRDGNRWSGAVQVLHSPDISSMLPTNIRTASKAGQPALTVDRQGRLHAVWSGGTKGEVFYSWAYERDALSAQGWAEPTELVAPTTVSSYPDIVSDARRDVLHVIYAIPFNEGRGVYYVRSNDQGGTWLTPTVVFDAVAAGWDSADKPRLALDANANTLHAVWLQAALPGGTGPQAIVYARSTDGGQTWSAPTKVAEGTVDWPRIIVTESTGQVHLFWNQASSQSGSLASAEVWSQYSLDGGQRWTEAARIPKFVEVSGPVGVASDGTGGLCLVGVGQITSGESALYYSRWNGQTWSERETFSLGQDATPGNAAVAAFAPATNRLDVLVRESMMGPAGVEQFEIVATGREVTIASAVAPVPTFTPPPTSTYAPTATPHPTATPQPQLAMTAMPPSADQGRLQGQLPLMIGGGLAMALALGVIIARVVWLQSR